MGSEQPFCTYPFDRLRVACDGEAHFCCYQRTGSLGNLTNSTLEELWFGKLAEEVRAETLRGRHHALCQVDGCPKTQTHPAPERKAVLPRFLEIDLPDDHCNIGGTNPGPDSPACIMCERDAPGYPLKRSRVIFDVLPKLRPLMPALTSIHVQGVAEAFWHDAIFHILDELGFDDHKDHIGVSTFTNGLALGPERRRRFLERCPRSMVTFSFDASTPETYVKIRRLDAYTTVLRNFIGYAQDRRAFPNAKLRIHNNINTLNVDEVVGMVRVAAEAEVDRIQFSPTLGWKTDILATSENSSRFREAQAAIESEARKLGVAVEFYRPLDNFLGRPTPAAPSPSA